MAVHKPRIQASEEINLAKFLILEFQSPEVLENKFLLFKPSTWWYFIMVALAKIYVFIWLSIHIYILLPYHLRRPRSNDTSAAINIPSTQIVVSNTFTFQKYQDFLEKCLLLQLQQKIYKMMTLKYQIVPESKEVLRNTTVMELCGRDKGAS